MLRPEENEISTFLRRVLLKVALVVASPFFMLAFLFVLLEKPALWSLIALAAGALIVAAAVAVWLVLRARLRTLQTSMAWVADNDIPPPPR